MFGIQDKVSIKGAPKTIIFFISSLIMAFFVSLVVQPVLAATDGGEDNVADEPFTVVDATTDVADLGEGRQIVRIYSAPRLLYVDENDKFQLRPDGWNWFNETQISKLKGDQISGYFFSVPLDNKSVIKISAGSMEISGEETFIDPGTASFQQNTINDETISEYKNVYPNVDIKFNDFEWRRKKEIVIREKPRVLSQDVIFWENYNLPIGATVLGDDDKPIVSGKIISGEFVSVRLPSGKRMVITPSIIFDASNELPSVEDGNAQYVKQIVRIDNETNTFSIGLMADSSYLNDPVRVYPVTIDPTFYVCDEGSHPSESIVSCSSVTNFYLRALNGAVDTRGTGKSSVVDDSLYIGRDLDTTRHASITFNSNFPASIAGYEYVRKAELKIYFRSKSSLYNGITSMNLTARRVNSNPPNWPCATVSCIESYRYADFRTRLTSENPTQTISLPSGTGSDPTPWKTLDVTESVRRWKSGINNIGFIVEPGPTAWSSGTVPPSDWIPNVITRFDSNSYNANTSPYLQLELENPDLIVSMRSASPTSLRAGSSIDLTATVTNQGLGTAPSSRLGYYLSTDNVFSSNNDIYLGDDYVSSLVYGGTSNESISTVIPSGTVAGNYYILFRANYQSNIIESNFNNNTSNVAITVTPVGDPLEPNNDYTSAYNIGTATTYTNNLLALTVGDEDWFRFTYNNKTFYFKVSGWGGNVIGPYRLNFSRNGNVVLIETLLVSGGTDTLLHLYDSDHVTELEINDDNPMIPGTVFSRIDYTINLLSDLAGSNLVVSNPNMFVTGEQMNMTARVQNLGDAAPGRTINYVIILRNTNTGIEYPLAGISPQSLPNIPAGYDSVLNFSGVIPNTLLAYGLYNVRIDLDRPSSIAESNENNNSTQAPNIMTINQNYSGGGGGGTVQDQDGDGFGDAEELVVGTSIYPGPQASGVFLSDGNYSIAKTPDIRTASYGADPVNLRTGAFEFTQTDFDLPGRGIPINFERTYNSKIPDINNRLGYGWTFAYNTYFYQDSVSKNILFNFGGRRSVTFTTPDNGLTFVAPAGELDTVYRDTNGYVVYRTIDGIQYVFSREVTGNMGVLEQIIDTNGNVTQLGYDLLRGIPLLSSIRDASGRQLGVYYGDVNGEQWDKIVRLQDNLSANPTIVYYDYDANGDLWRVRNNRIFEGVTEWIERTFAYDSSHRMLAYTDPRGTILYNEYDSEGKVIDQYEHNPRLDGTNVTTKRKVYHLDYTVGNYAPAPRSTTCTVVQSFRDATNFYTNRDCFDSEGLSVYQSDMDNNAIQLEYDTNGMILRKIDQNGNATNYTYDTRRRVVTERLPNTNSFITRVGYEYEDNFNRLTKKSETVEAVSTPGVAVMSREWNYGVNPTNGNVNNIVDPLGNTESFVYDSTESSVVNSYTDKRGTIFSYLYGTGKNYRVSDSFVVTQADSTTQIIANQYQYDIYGNRTRHIDPRGQVYQYAYDSAGNLRRAIDPLNQTVINNYDLEDNLVNSVDQDQKVTNFVYDTNIPETLLSETKVHPANAQNNIVVSYVYDWVGNKIKDVDPLLRETSYIYNFANRIERKITPVNTINYTYDANGNKIQEVNSLNQTTGYEYDTRNNLTRVKNYLDNPAVNFIFERNVYDGFNRVTENSDRRGNSANYTYDLLDRLLTMQDREGDITTYTYDANGNRQSELDENARVNSLLRNSRNVSTAYDYDLANRVIRVIDADNKETLNFYNANGQPVRIVDRRNPDGTGANHVTRFTYDTLGRQETVVDAYGATATTVYNAVGNILSQTDKKNNISTFGYDSFRRVTSETDALGNVTRYNYDRAGNKTLKTYPDLTTVVYTFDDVNRLRTVRDVNNSVRSYTYDAVGNILTETDKLGMTTTFRYDLLNRLYQEQNPAGTITNYTYDNNGNRLSEIIGGYQTLATTYDRENRPLIVTNPGGKTESYTYDGNGNIITKTDGKNQVTTFTYDVLNRLTNKLLADAKNVSYVYDNWGNQLSMTQDTYNMTQVFDNLNRPTREEQTFAGALGPPKVILRSFDANSNLSTLTDVANRTFTYNYDSRNLLDSVVYNGQTLADYSYTSVGRPDTVVYANGVNTNYDYDELNRVSLLEIKNVANATLFKQEYEYDAESNKTKLTENGVRTIDYDYDNLYQLTNVNDSNIAGTNDLAFTYDIWGNRQSYTSPLSNVGYTYATNSNELNTVSHNAGRLGINNTYDGNGSLTQEVYTRLGSPFRTVNYTWDAQNRLAGITYQDNSRPAFLPAVINNTVQYSYDDYGNRITKTLNSQLRTKAYYVNDGLNVLNELDSNGSVEKTMIAGVGELDAQGNITFVHTDTLGSTVLMTSILGTISAEYEYDPFGSIVGSVESSDNGTNYLFTGQEYDPESDLYYYNARYYNPRLGRFISRDRVLGADGDVIGKNRYVYVKNNPLRYSDPTGNEEEDVTEDFISKLTDAAEHMRYWDFWWSPDGLVGSWMLSHDFAKNTIQGLMSNLSDADINLIPDNILAELEGRPATFKHFYNKVKYGGEWDIKYNYPSKDSGWISQEDYVAAGDSAKWFYDTPPFGYKGLGDVRIGGLTFRNDVPGNVLFGYAGASVGFSSDVLKMLAGLANKNKYLSTGGSEKEYPYSWSSTYYDDPKDYKGIQSGVDLWNNQGDDIRSNDLFNEMYELHNNYGYEYLS